MLMHQHIREITSTYICWCYMKTVILKREVSSKNHIYAYKNRKTNLTFGVFRVIPSYLVRMEHIWCVFRKNKKIDEQTFLRSQNLRFWLFFLTFSNIFKILENIKNLNWNLRFCDRKNIFSSIFCFF